MTAAARPRYPHCAYCKKRKPRNPPPRRPGELWLQCAKTGERHCSQTCLQWHNLKRERPIWYYLGKIAYHTPPEVWYITANAVSFAVGFTAAAALFLP